jgi:hypothetical protein
MIRRPAVPFWEPLKESGAGTSRRLHAHGQVVKEQRSAIIFEIICVCLYYRERGGRSSRKRAGSRAGSHFGNSGIGTAFGACCGDG